ncbi:MAG: SPFH domain-containing protein [Ilumatobacter sp.]|nr:SPFH domain-containing protein [Ilumatobacter sp.]
MGIIQAFDGALGGTFADQWKDIITAGHFGEHTAVASGIHQKTNNGRGTNTKGSVDVISNGSKIFVPENTAAFVFSQAGIEDVITEPGGYEFQSGIPSVFNGEGFASSVLKQTKERFSFGGQPSVQHRIAFVNLREIRGIKFGTRGPVVYNDQFYGVDLELLAFGTFSLRIVDATAFVRNFLPPNTRHYAFDTAEARRQISSEFLQAFIVAVNSLSATHRISELPSHTGAIAELIADDNSELGAWITRFGLDVVQVGIESIELSPESRELVKNYSANKMNVAAFEGISQQASNVAAQQKIAEGVKDNGLGDGAGLIFGMNLAQGINPQTAAPMAPSPPPTASPSLDEQVEAVKKLKELVDAGILTPEEFEAKKKQVMGL